MKTIAGFEVYLGDSAEYNRMTAEILLGNAYVARVSHEDGQFQIEWPKGTKSFQCEKCDLAGFLEAINLARTRLIDEDP